LAGFVALINVETFEECAMPVNVNAAKAIFMTALEKLEPAERAVYVGEACGNDHALRQRVEILLKAHDDPGSFMKAPIAGPAAALLGTIDAPVTERPGKAIGPYKLLEHIGEGGFGVVFMAEQQHPVRRKVALKVIKPGMDTKQVIARFEAERQALALMDHPYIARVLDAGATDTGRPYFVMELVRGIPITDFCDANRLTPRERLELFVAVCQAVQHAHQKGIIHRDLKPSNALVTLHDGRPVVKVIDFGIAKTLGNERLTEKTLTTGFAQMVGTPLYMSPEQAEMSGQDADTRTDIYALGVLLYELLTGATPFDKERLKEASYDEIRRLIREEEPAKPSTRISTLGQAANTVSAKRKSDPRRLSQLFRGELDWIVMKALEKDRNRRHDTASSFAADVQRYLRDEPVQACPPSAVYRFRKFARRNRASLMAASVIAFAVLLAVAGLGVSSLLVWRANNDLTESLERERFLREQERQNAYYQRIAFAHSEWSANNLGRMQQLLEECPADLRGWEWCYLKRLRHTTLPALRHDSGVFCVAFNPTGQYLVSGSRDGIIKLWDAHTGEPLGIFRADGAIVYSVAFSPDGRRLAAGCSDGMIKMWEVQCGSRVPGWKAHSSPVGCLAFSPDGQRLASSRSNYGWEGARTGGEVKVWDAATGKLFLTLEEQPRLVVRVAFSPDGRRLATAGQDRTVKVWDALTGRDLFPSLRHTAPVHAVAFSPDGQWLASVSGDWSQLSHGELKVWDARTGAERFTLGGHIGFILGVAFSPDSRRLASGGMDRTIKLWDVATGRETLTLRGHQLTIQAVAFSPDGRQLASASGDHTVRLWDATPSDKKPGEEPFTVPVHPAGVLSVAFHPDGQWLATVGADAVKLLDSRTGKELFAFPDSQGLRSIVISPDGQRLAAGGEQIKVWDIRTGQELHRLTKFNKIAYRVAFSPDGRHLVSAHFDTVVRVWDTATGELVRQIPAHAFTIWALTISPNGKFIVTGSADDALKVWEMETGKAIVTLQPPHPVRPSCVVFRGDGKVLASSSADGTIKFWNTQTWNQQNALRDPTGGVESLAFSPDGRLLAWGSTDATVKIWDRLTHDIRSLRGHSSWVEDVAFSPDGKWIASASLDGTVKIWETPPLQESTKAAEK
jgi:WD40 repeat protein/serine/threonine protein kinase